MSTRSYPSSSMTGEAAPGATPGVAASECAPQPWSSDTTRPSSGANSFAQTPNTRPSGPSRRTRKPQVIHGPGAACARGLRGPCSPEYQRSAVSSRPMADNTLERLGPGSVSYPGAGPAPDGRKPVTGLPGGGSIVGSAASHGAASSQSSTPSSPSSTAPGTSRPSSRPAGASPSSSSGAGSRSPTPTSPGRTRSRHGTQSGARSESGPGSSRLSLTVTVLAREARVTVTPHRQPGQAGARHGNRG